MEIEMIEAPTTALTLPARAALALGSEKARTELAALVVKSKDVMAINSSAGREEAHSFAMALVKARTTITKLGKDAREDAIKFSKAILEEERDLVAITEPEEKRLLALRDSWDAKVAAEKEAKASAERARITAIHERIASIRGFHTLAVECRTAERAMTVATKLVAAWMEFDIEADFAEFSTEAQEVYNQTRDRIEAIVTQKKADEAERARIKAEQDAEATKLAYERKLMEEERAAIQADLDAKAAKAKAQADAEAKALAAERVEMQRQRDQIAADRLALENSQREAKEAEDRAAYAAAIAETLAPLPTPEIALQAPEPVADLAPIADMTHMEALVRSGFMCKPEAPSARELIRVVANHFDVSAATAAEWLTNAADEIANFE